MKLLLFLFVAIDICSCTSSTHAQPNKTVPGSSIVTTAYSSSEDGCTRTANGGRVHPGCAASDWSIFPLGTQLLIADHVYEVTDYGSALLKKRHNMPVIDIYQPSIKAMNNWGTRIFHNVQVVKWGDWHISAKILKSRLKNRHCRVMYNNIKSKL